MNQAYGPIEAFCADCGIDALANVNLLKDQQLYNAICLRNLKVMAERKKEPRYMQLQNRRAVTEHTSLFSRIRIWAVRYAARNFIHKQNTVMWAVLTHNLWVLARMVLAQQRKRIAA